MYSRHAQTKVYNGCMYNIILHYNGSENRHVITYVQSSCTGSIGSAIIVFPASTRAWCSILVGAYSTIDALVMRLKLIEMQNKLQTMLIRRE